MGNMSDTIEYKNYLHLINENNYYKILGVKDFSSIEEITKEYRGLAKKLHPDMYPNVDGVEKTKITEIFRKVNYAFNELRDVETKKRYDKELLVEVANKDKSISLKNEVVQEPVTDEKETVKKTETYVDPRLKGGFTFSKLDPVDIEKIKKENKNIEAESAKVKIKIAKEFIEKNDYDKAVDILVELTEKFSNVAEYHSYLGLAMQGKGWNGYAQAEFKIALHFDPNDKIAIENYKGNVKELEPKDKEKKNQSLIEKLKSLFKK